MTWELKQELVNLSGNDLLDFALKYKDCFDIQGWDMFFTVLDLFDKLDSSKLTILTEHLCTLDMTDLSWTARIRMDLMTAMSNDNT
jgi:hypothetical protein